MKKVLSIIAWFFLLGGAVWFLQGISLLPGSFMTGRIEWAVGGIVSVVIGLALRRYSTHGPDEG